MFPFWCLGAGADANSCSAFPTTWLSTTQRQHLWISLTAGLAASGPSKDWPTPDAARGVYLSCTTYGLPRHRLGISRGGSCWWRRFWDGMKRASLWEGGCKTWRGGIYGTKSPWYRPWKGSSSSRSEYIAQGLQVGYPSTLE